MPTERILQDVHTRRLIRFVLLATFLLLALWLAGQVILDLFASILLAVLLHGLASLLARYTHLPYRLALSLVVVGVVTLLAMTIYFVAPSIIAQSSEIADTISHALEELSKWVSAALPSLKISPEQLPTLSQVTSGFVSYGSSMIYKVLTVVIVVFIGFYAALNPPLYVKGFAGLFPPESCTRVCEILDAIGHSLHWWLLGRTTMMVAVAILTFLGLWMLAIPLALTLALIAGLLTFIPYLGALISAIPAVVIGFTQSPLHAAYVVLIYLAAHLLEGYILAPFIQQRLVHLPPALMLGSQALMAALFGIKGAALAAPVVVVLMVATKLTYWRNHQAEIREDAGRLTAR